MKEIYMCRSISLSSCCFFLQRALFIGLVFFFVFRLGIADGKMYDKMVTDNGHWNYCSSILRRKGRKRWSRICDENVKHHRTFPDYYFFLGSRLLHPVMQQPRECHRSVYEDVGGQIYGYRCTISIKQLLWFFIVFIFLNYTSLPSAHAATQVTTSVSSGSGGSKQIFYGCNDVLCRWKIDMSSDCSGVVGGEGEVFLKKYVHVLGIGSDS